MGMIMSPIHAIERVNFRDLKEGAKVSRIVKGRHGATFVLTESGSVLTDARINRKVALVNHCEREVAALVALGLVTKAEAKLYRELDQLRDRRRHCMQQVASMSTLAVSLGITFTAAQEKRLSKYATAVDAELDAAKAKAAKLNAIRAANEAKPAA